MGITGLLPLLKESIEQKHVSNFKGQRLAVDTYCWMHRAVYGYTEEMSTGKDSTRWIQYCMGILDMLLNFGIEVYLVFDGKNLPAKERTEVDRAASRSKNLELGHAEKLKGNKAEARSLLARSVDVSPRMAAQFIQVVKKYRPEVKYIVAPFEADAQLAYLCTNNLVDGVISEDSDCVPYGCKSILFKLDKQSGQCSHLSLDSLQTHSVKGFDLQDFNTEMMITMCVAAGCDYAPSPKNFGLKTSHRLVSKLKKPGRLLKYVGGWVIGCFHIYIMYYISISYVYFAHSHHHSHYFSFSLFLFSAPTHHSRSMKFDGIMPLVVDAQASSGSCLVYEYEADFYR